LVQEEQKRKHY